MRTLSSSGGSNWRGPYLKKGIPKEPWGGEYSYSKKQNFKLPPEEGKRCWTQQYQDEVDFHMDVLPSIPEEQALFTSIQQAGVAGYIAQEALAITDRRLPNYPHVDPRWPQSNPKGYAIWFDERMDVGGVASTARKELFNRSHDIYAMIDDVPSHRLKTPLQRAVQLLKRHRDQMFHDDPDGKPISIIITTLAAQAYRGETDLASGLSTILDHMGDYVSESKPQIANPVDPREDFADRWTAELEGNFWRWLRQAREDFGSLGKNLGQSDLDRHIDRFFSLSLPASAKAGIAAMSVGAPAIIKAQDRPVTEIKESAAPSWGSD